MLRKCTRNLQRYKAIKNMETESDFHSSDLFLIDQILIHLLYLLFRILVIGCIVSVPCKFVARVITQC